MGGRLLAEKFERAHDTDMVVSVFRSPAAPPARVKRALMGCVVVLVALTVGSVRPDPRRSGSPEERQEVSVARPVFGALSLLPTRARADDLPFTMEPGVVLSPGLRGTVAELAQAFRAAAGRSFHVTSGTRTPLEQAQAMFDKLASGGSLTGLYRDYDAARQIEQAYQRSRRAGRVACVAEMARVVSGQIARGLYISRHLHAGAVDIRSRDMSARERRTFRSVAARRRGVRLLEEGRPPHFHLEFPVNAR